MASPLVKRSRKYCKTRFPAQPSFKTPSRADSAEADKRSVQANMARQDDGGSAFLSLAYQCVVSRSTQRRPYVSNQQILNYIGTMSLPDGDPFRFLTFGGTLSRTFRLFFEHADVFLTLSAVVMIPFVVIVVTYFLVAVSLAIREAEAEATGSYFGFYPHHIPMLATVLGFQILTYAVVTILGRGAMCRAVAEAYLGQTPDWKLCLQSAWKRKMPLLGASLLVAVAILVLAAFPVGIFAASVYRESFGLVFFGTLVLLAFAALYLYAYASTVMVIPTLMIEPLPIPPSGRYCGFVCVEGLKRSWSLSAGSRCYILCSLLCMFVLHEISRQLLRNLFTNGGIFDSYFTIVGILVMMIPVALYLPLYVVVFVLCCQSFEAKTSLT